MLLANTRLLAAISAPYGDANSSTGANVVSAGHIHIFKRNSTGSWNADQLLTAEGSKAYDYLGFAMDFNAAGTQLVASAHGHDGSSTGGASGAGALHMFSRTAEGEFTLQKTVFHSDAAAGDGFGYGASFGKGKLLLHRPWLMLCGCAAIGFFACVDLLHACT